MDAFWFNCRANVDININVGRLISRTDERNDFTCFGHQFVDSQLFLQHLPALFNMARQKWSRMERLCNLNVRNQAKENWWLIRKEIVEFFLHLKCIVNSMDYQIRSLNFQFIFENLYEFIQSAGNLHKLHWDRLSGFYNEFHAQNDLYHFIHLNLDVRWIVLRTLNDMENYGFVSELSFNVVKYQQELLWEAVSTAFYKFINISLNDYHKKTPFPCSCVKNFWILLIHSIDSHHLEKQTDNFWFMLHGIFREINSRESEMIKKLTTNVGAVNELGFCWWLLLHMTPLYEPQTLDASIRSLLDCNSFQRIKDTSNHYEINSLLRSTFTSENGRYGEKHLRCYLRCCLKVLAHWEPTSEASTVLWEYYRKRFNESFMLPEELTMSLPHGKSGLHWKCLIEKIVSQTDDVSHALNSFQLFLKILAYFLNNACSKQRGWEELRHFIKLQPQLVQTLNKTGLYNCCCLIQILGLTGDLEKTISLFLNNVALEFSYLPDGGKNPLVWRSCFAMMFICLDKGFDLTNLARKMVENLRILQRETNKAVNRTQSVNWSFELLTVYFESLKDLFEHSKTVNLSQHLLLEIDFMDLLSKSPTAITHTCLTCVNTYLTKFKRNTEATHEKCQFQAIASSLFKYVFPWLKSLLTSDSSKNLPVDVLSSVAIEFTATNLFYNTSSPGLMKILLSAFCSIDVANMEFLCRYLLCLMKELPLYNKVEKEIPEFQTQVIGLWIFLLLQQVQSSACLLELSNLILSLSDVKCLFTEVNVPLSNCNNQSEGVIQFLKVLEAHHSSGLNLFKLRFKVNHYMSHIHKIIPIILKRNEQGEIFHMYHLTGQIVKHISPLIYTKSNPSCLFHELVNLLLLPSTVYNMKTQMSPTVTTALQENLSLFIEGIYNLDFIKDPYINRTLKDIFKLHLSRFTLNFNTSGATTHPLLVSFLIINQKRSNRLEFLICVIEAIRDFFFNRRETHPQLDMSLQFLVEVCSRCSSSDCSSLCPILLSSLFKLMLMMDNTHLAVKELLKLLVDGLFKENNSSQVLSQSLVAIIDEYFKEFQTIPEKIFRLLENISTLYPDHIRMLNPFLGEKISMIERLKCGNDEVLRLRYRQYLSTFDR